MDKGKETDTQRIMVNGRLPYPHNKRLFIEIQRGMAIKTSDGHDIGFCAGLLVNQCNDVTTHLLLGRYPPPFEYRLIPINCINHVSDNMICLTINTTAINQLVNHQPAWQ